MEIHGGYSISDKECEYIVEICKKIIKRRKKKKTKRIIMLIIQS